MNKRYMKGKWLWMLLICIAMLYPIHTQAAKTAINKKANEKTKPIERCWAISPVNIFTLG